MAQLNSTDYAIVIVFIVLSCVLPFIIGYMIRDKSFLEMTFAGRKLGFLSIALTMFLSINGSAQLTGLAGWAVHSGLGIYAYELVGCFGLLTLGWIFMPVYMASGVNTTIDYANKRFGGRRIGIVMVILMLFINLLSKFSVELHTAHIMLDELYEMPTATINVVMIVGALIVVYPGGLYSLVYTNNMQFLFFVVGMPVIFIFSYGKFSSWQEIQLRYQKSWPNTTIENVHNTTIYKYAHCGIPDFHSLDLIRSHNDHDLPWPGMIFGIYIISVYNFCIDQSILQFCLGAKDIVNAKYACIVSSFFKVFTIFLVIPGFIARILYTDIVACADPDVCERTCGKRSGCSDLALPQLYDDLVPQGWRGPVLVAFLAATLTSLAATFHSGSTIFVLNLYRPLRHGQTTEFECSMVRKGIELVQAFFGIALVRVIDKIPKMHEFMQQIYSTMVPPLVAVYLTGIFWEGVTEANAFKALVLGSSIAFIRLGWKLFYGFVPCGEESRVPDIIDNFHDLHFAVFLFVICASYILIMGNVTDNIDVVHLRRLIFWLRHDTRERIDINKAGTTFIVKNTTAVIPSKAPDGTANVVVSSPGTIKGVVKALDKKKKKIKPDVGWELDVAYKDVVPTPREKVGSNQEEDNTTTEVAVKSRWQGKLLTDEDLQEPMSARTLVKELPHETQTLNTMCVVLLLVIVFVTGFFS